MPVKGGHRSEEEKEKRRGWLHSEETKARMSATRTGRRHSEETLEKLRSRVPWNVGIPPSEVTRSKISSALKGKRNLRKGHPNSEETKAKLSELAKTRMQSPERRERLRVALTRPITETFWVKVSGVDSLDPDKCWVWTGATVNGGYGSIKVHKVTKLAHRVSWELEYGESPGDLSVCHKCDNPPCVRPSHLFLGTHSENMKDMKAKGRGRNSKATQTKDTMVE